jgi:hypothetical protein
MKLSHHPRPTAILAVAGQIAWTFQANGSGRPVCMLRKASQNSSPRYFTRAWRCADAINQNQTLPVPQNFDRRIGHHNARHNLATALDGARNPLHRSRFRHTRTGKAQIQAVQIEIQPLRGHGPELAAQSARGHHVLSLQTSSASSYVLDIKVIFTVHASIFANSAALAGTPISPGRHARKHP